MIRLLCLDQSLVMDTIKFTCKKCAYVYDPQSNMDEGIPFDELPGDWLCPKCFTDKSDFVPVTKTKPARDRAGMAVNSK